MAEYIEREAVFRAYMDLCTAKSKLAKARKGAAFFQSDLLPETELTEKEWVRLIQATPAADVAPVVRGRWMYELADNGWANYMCSKCGYQRNVDVHVVMDWDYCPYCGARMDLEVNSND